MPNFDEVANAYSEKAGLFNRYFIETKCDKLLELIKKYIPSNLHPVGVDLGCGIGYAEEVLSPHLKPVIGIDVSKNMIKKAKQRKMKNCEFLVGAVTHLPLKSKTFDFVFNFGLMHHLKSSTHEDFITECIRVVKNNGLIVTFDHNSFNLVTRAIVAKCEIDSDIERLTNAKELQRVYKKVGLAILESGSIIFAPIKLLDTFLTNLLGKSTILGGQFYVVGKVTH